MSIESDKKSDLYEKLISEEDVKKNVYGSGLTKGFKPDNEGMNSGGIRRSYDGRYFDSDMSNKPNMPGSNISDEYAKSIMQQSQLMHTCLCV